MTQDNTNERSHSPIGYFIGIGFVLLAGFFLISDRVVEIPLTEPVSVSLEQITPGVFRHAMDDPPKVKLGSYEQRCNDCHALFQNERKDGRALTQHTNIELHHGSNDACLNCHDQTDREKLTLRGGETVGYDKVEQLCAQCHGPVYRDWENGTHGKIVGHWNTDFGESIKLRCNECHDPHHPAYKPMAPLPGPNTLRMGDQHSGHGEIIDERNPLQRWRLLSEEAHGHTDQSNHSDHSSEKEGDHE